MNTDDRDLPHDPIPLEVANKLLELLSKDDYFREKFISDRANALIYAGLDPEIAKAASKNSCMRVTQLASKEELTQAHQLIIEHLCGTEPHRNVHFLNAGIPESPVLRNKIPTKNEHPLQAYSYSGIALDSNTLISTQEKLKISAAL